MTEVILFHNPRCSKSRETLHLLRDHNIEPEVVDYLHNPPSEAQIQEILQLLNKQPQEIMRKNESVYSSLKLDSTTYSNAQLIKILHENPILIERPIVLVHKDKYTRAAIGRPPENILEIL